jgi:dTDP-4-amino-4,6-dideoxygalactose transaminase
MAVIQLGFTVPTYRDIETSDSVKRSTSAARLPRERADRGRPSGAASRGWALDATPHRIPFNRPFATGDEFRYIREAIDKMHLSGNGLFGRRCARWLEEQLGCDRALLTSSCTSALELATLVAGVGPGDEVIMPSFTFVTTASSVALRGAVPVFVDIRGDTLNIDERLVEAAITPRTRAILPVHYAGVACEIEQLLAIAERHGLTMIEDAAQGISSSYFGRALGTVGDLGCLSFHETKNLTCGEGGALLVNRADWVNRAEVIQEKGTNRNQFLRGETDRYTWIDLGSSFLMSDINAAFLWAQIQHSEDICARRMAVWRKYHERFETLEDAGVLTRPRIPAGCDHNAHMYYLLLDGRERRDRLIATLASKNIHALFHYVPLHSSPAGKRFGRTAGELAVTDRTSESLVRLPLWVGMGEADVERVYDAVRDGV